MWGGQQGTHPKLMASAVARHAAGDASRFLSKPVVRQQGCNAAHGWRQQGHSCTAKWQLTNGEHVEADQPARTEGWRPRQFEHRLRH